MKKLNLDCGSRLFEGWININMNTVQERNKRLHRVKSKNR